MKLAELLNRPQAAKTKKDKDLSPWEKGQTSATKVFTYAAWMILICWPVALLLISHVVAAPEPAVEEKASTAIDLPHQQAGAVATGYVTTWLQADKKNPDELKTYSTTATAGESGHTVHWAYPGSITADGSNYVVTVVAASTANQTKYERTYAVDLNYDQAGLHPVGNPRIITHVRAESKERETTNHRATKDDAIDVVVNGFLTSYLTGTDDLDRFLTPGTTLTPAQKHPEAAVSVGEIYIDQPVSPENTANPPEGARIKISTTATLSEDATVLTTDYSIELTARTGRWEVSKIITDQPETHISEKKEENQ